MFDIVFGIIVVAAGVGLTFFLYMFKREVDALKEDKPLIETNKYLRCPKMRAKYNERAVKSSFAVEGIDVDKRRLH